MAGERLARERWQGPLLFLAALVLVGALASNLANLSGPLPTVPRAPDRSFGAPGILPAWLLAVLVWAFSIAALALLLGIYLWIRKGLGKRTVRTADLVAVVLAVTILLPLLVAWLAYGQAPPPSDSSQDANTTSSTGVVPANLPAQVARAVPVLGVAFTFVVLAFALASRGLLLRRARPPSPRPSEPEHREASNAVTKAIDDLKAGRDPREVILLCYATLTELLLRRGLSGLDPLTPREVERRALAQLGPLSEDDLDLLTIVFEEARYSDHPMGAESRDRALGALERLRVSLGA